MVVPIQTRSSFRLAAKWGLTKEISDHTLHALTALARRCLLPKGETDFADPVTSTRISLSPSTRSFVGKMPRSESASSSSIYSTTPISVFRTTQLLIQASAKSSTSRNRPPASWGLALEEECLHGWFS